MFGAAKNVVKPVPVVDAKLSSLIGKEIAMLKQAMYEIKKCSIESKTWQEYQTCIIINSN